MSVFRSSTASTNDRLQALRRYDVLDTGPEEAFDRFTELAAQTFGTQIAFAAFVANQQQWLKSTVGLSEEEARFALPLCKRTVASEVPVVVEDAAEDPRFAEDSFVAEKGWRFYAGAPLAPEDGPAIGILGVVDPEPRELSGEEVRQLTTLAEAVTGELELCQRTRELKATQEELNESKARYRALAEHFPNGLVALFDDELRYRLVRGSVPDDDAPVPEELEDRRMPDALDTETASRLAPHYRSVFAGDSSVFEISFRERLYRVRTFPVSDDPPRGLAIAQDITGQEERRRQLETLVGNLPGFVYRFRNEPGRPLEFVQGQVEHVLGYTAAEMEEDLGYYSEAIHPEDRKRVRERIQADLEEGERFEVTYRVITKGGDERWAWERGRQVEGPAGGALLDGFIADITERKETQQALEENERQIRGLASSVPGVLYQFRAEPEEDLGRLDYVSKPAENILGIDLDADNLFERIVERVPEPYREAFLESISAAIERQVPWNREFPFERPDGEQVWVQAVAHPEQTGGKTLFFNGVLLDVTERKKAEQALRKAKEEAEEAARLKDAMLANMSHEVRTPLTGILGFAEMLRSEMEGPEAELIGHIHDSGRRLRRTLEAMLHLSKLESGTHELSPQHLDLTTLVKETTEELTPKARKRGIDIEKQLSEPIPGRWDEEALREVTRSLLENAIKFTPEDGRARVQTYLEADDAVLEIEDTGVGISEDAQESVFAPFKQESEGINREYEGMGIGLTITRKFIELMNGTIDLESEKGRGTCFTVRLPRYDGPVSRKPPNLS